MLYVSAVSFMDLLLCCKVEKYLLNSKMKEILKLLVKRSLKVEII